MFKNICRIDDIKTRIWKRQFLPHTLCDDVWVNSILTQYFKRKLIGTTEAFTPRLNSKRLNTELLAGNYRQDSKPRTNLEKSLAL